MKKKNKRRMKDRYVRDIRLQGAQGFKKMWNREQKEGQIMSHRKKAGQTKKMKGM